MPTHAIPESQKLFQVLRPQPFIIPRTTGVARVSPRPIGKQQANYRERFDDRTLFYDVYRSNGDIVLNGPPLLNLADDLPGLRFLSGGEQLEATLSDTGRTQTSRIHGSNADWIEMESELGRFGLSVGGDLSHLFKDQNVLVTLSKDNELAWIVDWIEFHARHHGVTGVLFYDNQSSKYEPEDLLQAIRSATGIRTAVIVSWPFSYGPQGGDWDGVSDAPWDSDFCQYSVLEHARTRFLRLAHGIINADIDELVMTESGETVFELLERLDTAWVSYEGRWIETVAKKESSPPRFTDYSFYDESRPLATRKWSALGNRLPENAQFRPHGISNVEGTESSEVMHRHFMGLNSNWKWVRTDTTQYDSSVHRRDGALQSALATVGFTYSQPATRVSDVHPYRTYLEAIAPGVKSHIDSRGVPVKQWFFRDNCLVFDISAPFRFGIDLVRRGSTLTVKCVGRGPEAQSQLDALLNGSPYQRVSRQGHWEIAVLDTQGDIESTVADLVTRIDHLISGATVG